MLQVQERRDSDFRVMFELNLFTSSAGLPRTERRAGIPVLLLSPHPHPTSPPFIPGQVIYDAVTGLPVWYLGTASTSLIPVVSVRSGRLCAVRLKLICVSFHPLLKVEEKLFERYARLRRVLRAKPKPVYGT